MILLAALLLTQAAAVPAETGDIVVTAQRMERLKRLRMTTKIDRRTGTTRCHFKRRSGDPLLDDAVCNAVLACVPAVRTVQEMQNCIAPTMTALLAADVTWRADAATRDH
ncbi:hypothetical protein [Polymorphobacter fuscus]|uniref:hypothetical protein n=1 Tax=Sandarakinorhabdus fusca TaxID=1439888 RepID=UPI0016A94C4C|nr:hypothetical protein [Polymorphobacter fuscus]NJC10034.1 hypothetical protein [Polymorphobacter fuscus]